MLKTLEAVIAVSGEVRLLEAITLDHSQRALVTILDEDAPPDVKGTNETALLSEQALAKDWNRAEEEEAWSHLQPVR